MTLGSYSNFPADIHYIKNYHSNASTRHLQQQLIQVLGEVNQREFRFEEVTIPTVPDGWIIFEFGLADGVNFNFIDAEEVAKALDFIDKGRVRILDFFCSIRYYRGSGVARAALKFDYYMLRVAFEKGNLQVAVSHERGPRYIYPEDMIAFLLGKINGTVKRKILREINP